MFLIHLKGDKLPSMKSLSTIGVELSGKQHSNIALQIYSALYMFILLQSRNTMIHRHLCISFELFGIY